MQDKQLIGKSHIIPEFMYQDLFDNKHKIYVFSPYAKLQGQERIKRPSSGEYENGLLCADCDNKLLGSYEDYASKAIYGGELPANECPTCENYENQHGVKFTGCKNISYKKFKIFLLSVLWRSSISSRPLFSEISLGPHEEIIRKMIYEGNPGEASDYPIFFMTFVNDKSMSKDIIAQPQRRRTKDGHSMFVFMIGGMLYCFYVNARNHTLPEYVVTETIKPTNDMNIFHIPPGQGWDIILGFMGLKRNSH
ncbi:MAG: hypothetical protein HY840_07450 [Bacteroidetes bacterium]|nr:hypothetical protein [Bacteroidota bacterium]